MKKLAIIAMTLIFATSAIQANARKDEKNPGNGSKKGPKTERIALHKLEGTTVSEIAKSNFKEDFSNVSNVEWKRNGTFDEASFIKGGRQMTAFYDIDGNLVGTTRAAAFSELPSKGQKELKSRYKDYKMGPVIYFEDNESNISDMILYGIQFDDADTWLVELSKGSDKIVVQVFKDGMIDYFTRI